MSEWSRWNYCSRPENMFSHSATGSWNRTGSVLCASPWTPPRRQYKTQNRIFFTWENALVYHAVRATNTDYPAEIDFLVFCLPLAEGAPCELYTLFSLSTTACAMPVSIDRARTSVYNTYMVLRRKSHRPDVRTAMSYTMTKNYFPPLEMFSRTHRVVRNGRVLSRPRLFSLIRL